MGYCLETVSIVYMIISMKANVLHPLTCVSGTRNKPIKITVDP